MTEQSGESIEPKPEAGEPTPVTNPDGNVTGDAPAPVPTDTATAAATATGDEGLPEWEPLTPELVEDEAIRGDFVIRWVVVGLALLLGTSQIAESKTLLHLKNGQHLIANGFFPTSKDVFSYTASDRKWINLSWLFDIAAAGVHWLGGGIGLSIVQGLLAGLTFGLLAHTVRPNIRTWWASICAVLALLACYPQFTVQPELITLLGLSFVLWTLAQSEEQGQSVRLWRIVPALWVWAQFDQRAWFGWFLLMVWTAGEWISREAPSERQKGLLLKVTIASFLLVAVHPFLWESWLAPVRMYLSDYPAMRYAYPKPLVIEQVFFPIWREFLWVKPNHRTIAALVLAAATVITMVLNRSQVRWSHLFAFLGFNAMSLFATHELAAASLVNCVICSLNAQAWYREKFGQVYSIDWRELLFSRGGRAVTVMSFFTLAWLVLSGRVDGPGGKRTGIGFENQLATAMADYQSLSLVDDHPFHFSIRQSDLMIWGGQKTFVDNRVGLFYGDGDENLFDLHSKTRLSLRKQQGAEGADQAWKATFERYQIRQAMPRLNGTNPLPDYETFSDLLASKEFQLCELNSSTAVFVRTDPQDSLAQTFLKDQTLDVVKLAFRTKTAAEEKTREWSKAATTYDNLFALRRPIVPAGVQAAQHFLQWALIDSRLTPHQRCACTVLAIRFANEGLRNEPNSPDGYRVLGWAYVVLGGLESDLLKQGEQQVPNPLRYIESVAAFQQSLALRPDDVNVIQILRRQYDTMGRVDAQLELVRQWKKLLPSKSLTEEQRKERKEINDIIDVVGERVGNVDGQIVKALADNADRFQLAARVDQTGCLLRAIKVLDEDAIYLRKNPQAMLSLGNWQMEAGHGKEAAEVLETLEGLGTESGYFGWRDTAAVSALTSANYLRSIALWNDQIADAARGNVETMLLTLPFARLNRMSISSDAYPTANVASTAQVAQGVCVDGAQTQYRIALAEMEFGLVENAADSIRQAIQLDPRSYLRPILRFYLECLTGEKIDLKPPITETEELTDLAEPEPAPTKDNKPEEKAEPKVQ